MIRPLGNKIVIKLDEAEKTTTSGIILSTTERPVTATVLAVGLGSPNLLGNIVPLTVKEGDRVLLTKYAGTPVRIDDEDLLVVTEAELIGIL